MAAEAGHAPNRVYIDQNGAFHLNGASFFNDAEADLSASLETLNDLTPTELGYLDGLTAGTATASKAVVLGSSKEIATLGAVSMAALTCTSIAGSGDIAATGHITMTDAKNIVLNATTGTKIGTATTQKLAFFNSTPIVQPSAYTQTYATADKTHANPTATAHTYPGSGNLFDAVAADLLINIRTDSVENAVADTVVNVKSLADNLNQEIADLADLKQLVNSLIDDLQALGLVG